VFGSFNASRKINRGLIALWSRLLRETPGSTMILKSFDFAARGATERLRDEFARHGIGPDRLTFLAATRSLAEHLALYSRMDVALDAFPYHGTTTTCEALWMGVPVVTLAGRTHAGRVGVSLLTNAGVPELIAPSEDEYVRIARETALDGPRLAAYRASLRGHIAASPICDADAFAARFQEALRAMWRAWCSGGAGGAG
jgi:predicted O-linked N-acetylglucosamine transferase (SPINDLY family)